MSVSDELMWRYYELLTDVKVPEIEQMKADAATGKQHPMQLKKALARRIVQDFHGEQAAKAADENWAKQFQKDEVPEDVETVTIKLNDELLSFDSGQTSGSSAESVRVRLPKLLQAARMAKSGSEALRKVRQNAVKINGIVCSDPIVHFSQDILAKRELLLQVGRQLKRIAITN